MEISENNEVDLLMKNIEKQNVVRKNEIEMQREIIKRSLEGTLSKSERDRLLKQLEAFEDQVKDQLRNE